MISELEKKVSEEEDLRIMEKIKDFSLEKKRAYEEGYADGILYSNKLTVEIYNKWN